MDQSQRAEWVFWQFLDVVSIQVQNLQEKEF